jgi:hypothetical protein
MISQAFFMLPDILEVLQQENLMFWYLTFRVKICDDKVKVCSAHNTYESTNLCINTI